MLIQKRGNQPNQIGKFLKKSYHFFIFNINNKNILTFGLFLFNRFLLQIFTLPIFQEETFFLEVVQRQGARGFGAGNVTALAKSIEQEKKKKSQAAVHQTSL